MSQVKIELPLRVAAPVEQVFGFFADHDKMASLFGARATTLREGQGHPCGLGAVRRVGSGPFQLEETVLRFEPHHAIDYAITRGGPIKNHLGQIRFHPDGTGTRVEYVIRFESRIPGTGRLLAAGLRARWAANAPKRLAMLEGR